MLHTSWHVAALTQLEFDSDCGQGRRRELACYTVLKGLQYF